MGSDVVVNVERLWGAGRSALCTHLTTAMDNHLKIEEETQGNHKQRDLRADRYRKWPMMTVARAATFKKTSRWVRDGDDSK